MADIRLGSDHDIDLTTNSFELTSDETNESIAQRLKIRLWFFLGEYYFNEDFGVPYFQEIFQKGVSKTRVDDIFKEQILACPGVLDIISFSTNYNTALRSLNVNFVVRTQNGEDPIEIII